MVVTKYWVTLLGHYWVIIIFSLNLDEFLVALSFPWTLLLTHFFSIVL